MAKLLIVTPIFEQKEYCLHDFLKHLYSLNLPEWEHVIIDNSADNSFYRKIKLKYEKKFPKTAFHHVKRGSSSREALARAQSLGRKLFLEGNYTHFLSLESDIFPVQNAIKMLLFEMEDVITGWYNIGEEGVKVPCVTIPEYQEDTKVLGTRILGLKPHPKVAGKKYIDQHEIDEYQAEHKVGVIAGGMGCCLIKRYVLEKISFQFEVGLSGHSDIWFFNDCYRQGISVFVMPKAYCDHQNSPWSNVRDA